MRNTRLSALLSQHVTTTGLESDAAPADAAAEIPVADEASPVVEEAPASEETVTETPAAPTEEITEAAAPATEDATPADDTGVIVASADNAAPVEEAAAPAEETPALEGLRGALSNFLLNTAANLGGGAAGGLAGSAAGPIGSAVGSSLGASAAHVAFSNHTAKKVLTLKKQIEDISDRIAKAKNGDLEEAKKKGAKLQPHDVELDGKQVLRMTLFGTFIPFYNAVVGHGIEEMQKQLQKKLDELEGVLEAEGVATESIIQEALALEATGFDPVEETAAVVDAPAEEVVVETAAELPSDVPADAVVEQAPALEDVASMEGWGGAVRNYLLNIGAVYTGALVGGAAGTVAGPAGTVAGAAAGSVGASVAFANHTAKKALTLKKQIEDITNRIADAKNGDLEDARKKGAKLQPHDVELDGKEVLKKTLMGTFIPFYNAYNGYKIEEMQKELQKKLDQLKIVLESKGIATESVIQEAWALEAAGVDPTAQTDEERQAEIEALRSRLAELETPAATPSQEGEGDEVVVATPEQDAAQGEAEAVVAAQADAEAAVAAVEPVEVPAEEPTAVEETTTGEETYSEEGIGGAIKALLTNTAASIGGAVAGGAVGAIGGPVGMVLGAVAGAGMANSYVNVSRAAKIKKLKEDIQRNADKLAALKEKDLEAAVKAGKAKKSDTELTGSEMLGTIIKGGFIPFYETYKGHEAEELQKKINEQLAEMNEEMTKAVEEVKKSKEKASNESVSEEAPAEEVAVDDSDLNEALADQAEAEGEVKEVEQTHDQLQRAAESLESIALSMESALNDGGLHPQAAKFMQIAVESQLNAIGVEQPVIPSLESFGGMSARMRATQVSLEGIKETIAKVWEQIVAILKKLRDAAIAFFKRVFTSVGRLRDYLEALEKKLETTGDKTSTIELVIPAALANRLAIGEKLPRDLAGAIEDIVAVALDSTEFDKEVAEQLKKDHDAVVDAVATGDAEAAAKIMKNFVRMPKSFKRETQEQKFGADVNTYLTAILPGNVRIGIGEYKTEVLGVSIAYLNTGTFREETAFEDGVKMPMLSKSDIKKVIAASKQACVAVGAMEHLADGEFKAASAAVADLKVGENASQMTALLSAYRQRGKVLMQLSQRIAGHAVTTAGAAAKVAHMAVEQYEAK